MSTTATKPLSGWISVRHLQHMIGRGEAAGLRFDDLLGEAGLSREKLVDGEGRVPLSVIESVLSAVSERYPDPLVGLHAAQDIKPAVFGPLGHILQACTTFADALEVVIRYRGLLSNIGRSSMRRTPGEVQLCWECLVGGPALRRQATEYVLATFAAMTRALLPGPPMLQSVHFAHARAEAPEAAREYFQHFNCPVYFDRAESSLNFPDRVLQMRLPHGDALMKDLLERHARSLLAEREQPRALTDEVRHLIQAMIIEGVPMRDRVAEQLGMSGRSLHRKLIESGSGYRELLDEVRLDLARQRLRDSEDSVTVIAEFLAFHSHQAFLRWFKQASGGQTPGQYRKARQQGGTTA
ncbi:AraC family transcriptional regulator [Solimonas sp. K1W22B-7]|uniref:AraC family transcriptional regulator n=1 Tax=Solimonas sp. K1W22B-7 TaxID=2303331 RepID=UPI0013C4D9C3|nr:AraC family transcriptional regulator [Solimonas sp. K1W22B-7]